MGLQISFGLDNEVPLSGAGGGRWPESARIAAGNIPKHGADDLSGGDQQGSCAHADRDTAERIGIEGSAISEGEEFA